jgi:hypothetical protein
MAFVRTENETSGLREFLNSPRGKVLTFGAAFVLLVVALAVIWRSLGPSEAAGISRHRVFVDAKTGKTFNHSLEIGETIPVEAPSGGKTGYPAELCYWTREGSLKSSQTYVLLNQYKGDRSPTFCPDCGRLVIQLNPPAIPGDKAPPTKAEYVPERQER